MLNTAFLRVSALLPLNVFILSLFSAKLLQFFQRMALNKIFAIVYVNN